MTEETENPCIGCLRNEMHKRCPAHGTPFYLSNIKFSKEIEILYKDIVLKHKLCTPNEFFNAIARAETK